MTNNNNYNNQLDLIQGENINVGNAHDGKDFFVLLAGIAGLIIVFLAGFSFFANIVIDNMSNETQRSIEKLFGDNKIDSYDAKYNKKIAFLTSQKNKIVALDPTLQNKSQFPIGVLDTKQINAMIYPNGNIYFTSGILDKNYTNQELSFVLAHELGHYAHRDHLKSISKQLAIIFLCAISGQNSQMQNIVNGISEIGILHHSRGQEKEADLYAGNMLINLYGTNSSGQSFIKKISKDVDEPYLLEYFSTHPSWETRLKALEDQNNGLW